MKMSGLRFGVMLALLFVAACTTTASDGRYQTGGGSGWSNFCAEAPGGTVRPS